jgi:hypothetical protein
MKTIKLSFTQQQVITLIAILIFSLLFSCSKTSYDYSPIV